MVRTRACARFAASGGGVRCFPIVSCFPIGGLPKSFLPRHGCALALEGWALEANRGKGRLHMVRRVRLGARRLGNGRGRDHRSDRRSNLGYELAPMISELEPTNSPLLNSIFFLESTQPSSSFLLRVPAAMKLTDDQRTRHSLMPFSDSSKMRDAAVRFECRGVRPSPRAAPPAHPRPRRSASSLSSDPPTVSLRPGHYATIPAPHRLPRPCPSR